MKVITKNNEELDVKEIHVENENGLSIILKPNQIQRFCFEDLDYSNGLNNYEIERVGHLALCFKTFINHEVRDNEIDICEWNDDFSTRWTIASFEPKYDDGYLEGYELVSCGERLNKDINWKDFGILVRRGYKWLSEHTNKEDED